MNFGITTLLVAIATSAAAAESSAVSDQQLYAKAEEAWQASWQRFYDERTHLFYDYVCSFDPQKRLAGLPKPEETARQYPNRNGWGTGMEDCAISGGVMLSMICDRFAATGDDKLRPFAAKAFAGLVLLGTLSPSEGFVIRGVCPFDGRSHYCESSRDQYTWYAYGLWRYYRSPLSTPAEKATMRKIITAICARLERNVVAANDYHIGREDGTFDGVVDKMWENAAHEVARLPMIYAIGADLTGESRWRELARRFAPEAAAKSKGASTKIPYALLQQQVSLEALYQLEESPELKQQWLEAMRLVAGRSLVFLPNCREYRPQNIEQIDLDWRTWPLHGSMSYQVPTRPDFSVKDNRTTREPAEAALVQLLCPQPALTPEQLALVKQMIAQVDYPKSVWYGLYYTQAVYWRAVRLGLLKLPGEPGVQGAKGQLTVDEKGISLTPSIASCPRIRAKGAPVWAVLLQKDGRPPIQGDPVVLTNQGQQVKRETLPDGIRLTCQTLADAGKTWQISVSLAIHCRGDAFEVTGEVKNEEPGWMVCAFTGPVLDGIQADLAIHPVLLPEGFGRRISRGPEANGKASAPWRRVGNRFEVESSYPSNRGTMQWCAMAGAQGGFYLGCHDADHGAKTFSVRCDAKDHEFGLAIKHYAFCPAGKRWTLPPTVFMPYEGTWHTAARYYRAWVDSATPLRETPAWVRNASGWLLGILKQQNGEVLWDYPALESLCTVADQRGLDILGLFGWAHGGHDHLYPDYHPDPQMGGKEALRHALQEARRRGKRSILYANGQLQERDTEFWKTQGKDLAVIQRNGVSVQQTWHKYKNALAYEFDLGCLAAQGWYDRMLSLALQANELGADGILFDQLGNTGPMACYAAGHGHPTPSMVYTSDRVRLLRRIADHMKAINPEFIVMTEGLHDSVLDSISLFHGCVLGVFPVSSGEIAERLRTDAASAAMPELFRYTFPEAMSTVRVPTPMLIRTMVNYACLYGFRYEIESRYAPDVRYLKENKVPEASQYEQVLSKPDIAAMHATPPEEATRYLTQVIEFQRANADVLWRGRFADQEGFAFQGPGLIAKSYLAGNRLAVLVWNPGGRAATFTVGVPDARLVSASEPEKGKVEPTSELAPDTVRLLLWEK